MIEVLRYETPTLEQLEQAAEVCHERWSYMREWNTPDRLRGFQRMGVQLAAFLRDGRMEAVTFLLPVQRQNLHWHFMFQVASRPGIPGAGVLLVKKVMHWYRPILGMGITPDAERIYQALRWTYRPKAWRGVHPVQLKRMVADYGERLARPWQRRLVESTAGLYNGFSLLLENMAAATGPVHQKASAAGKEYLTTVEIGKLTAADVGGAGRIGNRSLRETSLREHAALWQWLRRRNARFCEVLLLSEEERRHAIRRGYVPLRLEVYYWDPENRTGEIWDLFEKEGLSFLETDKGV